MKNFIACLTIIFSLSASAQSIWFDRDYYHRIDRLDQFSSVGTFSTVKPMSRQLVREMSRGKDEFLYRDNSPFSDSNRSDKPLLKWFYKNKTDLLSGRNDNYEISVRPILYFSYGRESIDNQNLTLSRNTRGVRVFGSIDNKITFSSRFTENQVRFPGYMSEFNGGRYVIPNLGFWKRFGTDGIDYFQAAGHFAFKLTKSVTAEFGQDNHFYGNGIRSLVLSDFGNSFPYLKLTTNVGKVKYTNLFAQLTATTFGDGLGTFGNTRFPTKYMALHHLSVNIGSKLNIGLFESIIYHRGDSSRSDLELAYLNPLIFYRAVEQDQGSPDNAAIGFDFKWKLTKNIQTYGQLFVDEMVLSRLFDGQGWWGNKVVYQLGAKWFDFLKVQNLDIQLEYNFARPYTYAHADNLTNYTHYDQSLAHPLGANFNEYLAVLRYKWRDKLMVTAQVMLANKGLDDSDNNFGGDIFRSYGDVAPNREIGNHQGQGVSTNIAFATVRMSYMLRHNLFVDLTLNQRHFGEQTKSTFANLGLRLNHPFSSFIF